MCPTSVPATPSLPLPPTRSFTYLEVASLAALLPRPTKCTSWTWAILTNSTGARLKPTTPTPPPPPPGGTTLPIFSPTARRLSRLAGSGPRLSLASTTSGCLTPSRRSGRSPMPGVRMRITALFPSGLTGRTVQSLAGRTRPASSTITFLFSVDTVVPDSPARTSTIFTH